MKRFQNRTDALAFWSLYNSSSKSILDVLETIYLIFRKTTTSLRLVWRLRGNIIRAVLYIANVLPLQRAQLTKTVDTARLGLQFILCFLCCMIYFYVGVCFVLPWSVESFPFMFWRWHNKLKWAPFEFFAPSPLLRVRSWLHPFKGHCEQQAMRDEGVIYVAGHPLLNRRCTWLPGCIRLRNDLYCVEWGVKLYSLTHF